MRHDVKFPKKVMAYGGISKQYKTPLIIVERSTIDAVSYIDDLIDQSGLIPDMNFIYGIKGWILMQDGATDHSSEITMDYLKMYVLDGWPAMS